MKEKEKIEYVKPEILDLGPMTPIYGQCAPNGSIASGEPCSNGGNAAGGQCTDGSNPVTL